MGYTNELRYLRRALSNKFNLNSPSPRGDENQELHFKVVHYEARIGEYNFLWRKRKRSILLSRLGNVIDERILNDISVIHCIFVPRAATTNLPNSCTCGMEGFPSVLEDTFVNSEFFSYTGQTTPLLLLSGHSYTREIVHVNRVEITLDTTN
ncbi:hypothetical protein TNCV_1030341 [Trichonephila clavipes]|nr:hypothetical protein TNCV_1030341 [Trichonephila clavipes]